MGAGASSSNSRLRKALILRAYNARENGDTLEDQFKKYTYKKGSKTLISIEKVKSSLSMDAPWVDELFRKSLGSETADIEFDTFLGFLQTGYSGNGESMKSSTAQPGLVPVQPPPVQLNKKQMPPVPPLTTNGRSGSQGTPVTDLRVPAPTGVAVGLSESPSVSPPDNQENSDDILLPLNPSNSRALVSFLDSGSSGGMEQRIAPPGKPLWRKREVVRSERTVHYTTVDASGLLQELIEKESTETEVLHMECRETGEFAHRETTKYEQQETFNSEIVAEEKGCEEYVHLKSLDDEIEYLESSMPKRGKGGGEPPPDEEPNAQSPDGCFTESGQRRSHQETSFRADNPDAVHMDDGANNENGNSHGASGRSSMLPDDSLNPNSARDDIFSGISGLEDLNVPNIEVSAPRPQVIDPLLFLPREDFYEGAKIGDQDDHGEMAGGYGVAGIEKDNASGARRRRTWSVPPAAAAVDSPTIAGSYEQERVKTTANKTLAESEINYSSVETPIDVHMQPELLSDRSGSSPPLLNNSSGDALLMRYNSFEVD